MLGGTTVRAFPSTGTMTPRDEKAEDDGRTKLEISQIQAEIPHDGFV